MVAHLNSSQLQAYLEGRASESEATQIQTHMAECDACRELVTGSARTHTPTQPQGGTKTPASARLWVQVGDIVQGRFRIEKLLGVGGMGVVFSAWHLQLNQRFALKFMSDRLVSDPQAGARFLREARAAARLQTAHVGRVTDLGMLESGTPFLVMEYLDGETVEARLKRVGRFSVEQVLELTRQMLIALQEAHSLKIIHRDLKPANLFFAQRPDGTEIVKVLDFGIAKSANPEIEDGLLATASNMIVGSPAYMSPEQLAWGGLVTVQTDIWAVGCVVYELLTGAQPFDGQDSGELARNIQGRPHPHLRETHPELPPRLMEVVDRCLRKDPAERYPDVASLAAALANVSSSGGTVEELPAPPLTLPRRRWGPWAAAGAVGLLGMGGVLWKLLEPPAPEPVLPATVVAQPAAAPTLMPPSIAAEDRVVPEDTLVDAGAPRVAEPVLAPPESPAPPPRPAPSPKAFRKAAQGSGAEDVFGERK